MILNTRRLFCRLLRTLAIETVCDVGSMDGSDALLFRRFLPSATILALEPNPANFALMRADERLAQSGVRALPFAASDRRAEAPFFVVKPDCSPEHARGSRGMSSLHRRPEASWLADVVPVQTVRLDDLLEAEAPAGGPIALWIDAEGAAFEVIRGASGIAAATKLIHAEVETRAVIGAEQKLFADVEPALTEAGFKLLATDQPRHFVQFNAVFVRTDLPRREAREVQFWANAMRLRRIITSRTAPLLQRAGAPAGRARAR